MTGYHETRNSVPYFLSCCSIVMLINKNSFQISPESEIGCLKSIEFCSYFFGSVDKAIEAIQSKSRKLEKKD